MAIRTLFPTQIFHSSIQPSQDLVNSLLSDALKIAEIDEVGLEWSEERYFGGYTSYSSYNRLQEFSSSFAELESLIDVSVEKYVEALGYDIEEGTLKMSNCWLNIMPTGTHHSGHIHPNSILSGTFYLQMPEDSPGIKFEDPRLIMQMNTPGKSEDLSEEMQSFVSIKASDGDLVLFESYLRHEVPANQSEDDRISISFNYEYC
ncbi:MAG: TIGR02466 family protein [Bdellovibrionota bacterium]|nr:TIGR02466 family protein [Bdellovibrionota bacterium]